MNVIQAALASRGLALVSDVLVRHAVERGWLASSRPEVRLDGGAYRLVLPAALALEVQSFADWIAGAAAGEP